MRPDPPRLPPLLFLWSVGLVLLGLAGTALAAANCRSDEVAEGEWISETCSCRGWTIAAQCLSACCGRTAMVGAIQRMCGEVCDRADPEAPVEESVRQVDDGSARLQIERSPIEEDPQSRPGIRLGLSGFSLFDADDMASDLFDGLDFDMETHGVLESPELDTGNTFGLGATIGLSPRWSLDLGVLRADEVTADADLDANGFERGRVRSELELTGLWALARFGLDRPDPTSRWHLILGARSLRLEPSSTELVLDEATFEPELPLLDIEEGIAGLDWRWPFADRLAGEIEATYGTRSSWSARFGFTFDLEPPRPARRLQSYDLDVDTNRNGRVEDGADEAGEASFSRQAGAIVLANLDADAAPPSQDLGDAGDEVLGNQRDVRDMAPLIVRRSSTWLVRDPELRISLGTAERVRIFWSDQPVLGPASGRVDGPYKVWRIPSDAFAEGETRLYAEALEYPSATHGGEIVVELTGRNFWLAQGRQVLDRVRLQIAPWMMIHQLQPAQKIFWGRPSSATITNLRAVLERHGWDLGELAADEGRWTQDWQEIGFSRSADGVAMHSAYRASCKEVVQRGVDLATFEIERCGTALSVEATGNLEVTPPLDGWPLGRIYYGGKGDLRMDRWTREFLDAQRVQAPIELDSSWLSVGHVDEFVSFVPNPKAGQLGEKAFKVLIASPKRAMGLLFSSQWQGWTPSMPACAGTGFTVGKLLDSFSPNVEWQRILTSIREQMATEFRLDDSDFIEIPVLYRTHTSGRAVAALPNAVNLLVIDRHLVLPDPCFGPWRDDIVRQLEATGYQLDQTVNGFSFVPAWDFHLAYGEIHCATNSQREIPTSPWWQSW